MSVERHFIKVEKAKEFEAYKRLPKYTHVPLACINPSPRKQKSPPKPKSPSFTIAAHPAKMQVKRYEHKQIPDHLMRAPMDSFTSSPTAGKSRPKSQAGKGRKGSPKKGGDLGENKKIKRAETNRKVFYQEIKKLLDKADEAASAPGGSAEVPVVVGAPQSKLADCKDAIRDRRLLRFLYAVVTGYQQPDIKIFKQEFITFVKNTLNGVNQQARAADQVFSDSELGDLFLLFCKRLEAPAP
jgi:hypothetical protein